MDLTGHKQYENLDWLTQAVEPLIFPTNELLGRLPDEFEITYDVFHAMITKTGLNRLDRREFLEYMVRNAVKDDTITSRMLGKVEECYKVKTSEPEIEIDFTAGVMIGKVFLVKVKTQYDEDEIKEEIMRNMTSNLHSFTNGKDNLKRFNEILDLLNLHEARRSTSLKRKVRALQNHVAEKLTNDEWKIRDFNLALKISSWIVNYVNDGCLANFSNFCKFKIMTHSGLPIYKVEETK